MGQNHDHGWTAERIETLKTMWADGASGREIANKLGGITRNACIGKIHRLGLAKREVAASPMANHRFLPKEVAHARRLAPPAPRKPQPSTKGNAPMRAGTMPQTPPAPDVEGKIILFRRLGQCGWPLGPLHHPADAYTKFCCEPSEGPFCPHHARIAYQTQGKRSDKQRRETERALRRFL